MFWLIQLSAHPCDPLHEFNFPCVSVVVDAEVSDFLEKLYSERPAVGPQGRRRRHELTDGSSVTCEETRVAAPERRGGGGGLLGHLVV